MWSGGGRWLGAAVLAAALCASPPCAAAAEEPPAPLRTGVPHEEPPARLRTGAQILGFLGLDFLLLSLSAPPAADPPGNVRLIDKLTLKAWSWDASAFETNFGAHPLAGTFYYTTARSNRSSPIESLAWASLASLTWEVAEFPENVSFNDLVVTPIAGASIGESLVQLSQWLDRGPRSPASSVLAAVLFPMKLLNGGPPAGDFAGGALSANLRLLSGLRLHGDPEVGVRLATRLVRFPGFGEAGEGTQIGFAGNVSGLSIEARANRSGLADLRLGAGAAMATMYQRAISAGGEGWDLLASAGVAYQFREHAWDAGPKDAWSSVHMPGLGFQIRRIDGPLRVTLRADLGLTLAGTRSFALDGAPGGLPVEALTTTQRAWGYTMGWGLSAAPSLEVAYGPLSFDFAGAIDTRYGLLNPDPWPDRHPTGRISDSWSTLRGGARLKLPWNDLEISASIERNLRRGTADVLTRTAGETVALVGLGFALE